MNIERRVGGSDPLGGQFGGVRGQLAQRVHVPGGQQLALVGPSLDTARGAYSQEAPAHLENFQAVAMLDGGNGGRLKRNVAADLQDGGTDEGFADRLRARRTFGTAGKHEQNGCQRLP